MAASETKQRRKSRVRRRMTRPVGESDEVAAAKARRILREKGFVPR